jgi:long-chain fatty acid transport protein
MLSIGWAYNRCRRGCYYKGKAMKLKVLGSLGLMVLGGGAQAAGFALTEQNASGLGNAFAGQAAVASDASTVFFNPAGMTALAGRQFAITASGIGPSAKFSNAASSAAPLQGLGGNGGDAGGWALVPSLYYVMDIQPGVKFGLGINSPFGLKTEYDSDWMGRFFAVKSDLKAINVNPSLAFKINDSLSAGIGLNAQQVTAELTNKVNDSAIFYQATSGLLVAPGIESLATVKGDDWAWGYNFGLLLNVDPATRLGFNYRSRLKFKLKGDVQFTPPAGLTAQESGILSAATPNGDVTAEITLPDSASLSLFRTLDSKWDLLADVTWTHWSLFKDLTVVRSNGTQLSTTPENWRDNWRYSVGLNYHQDAKVTWRFGVAYDQSPVDDAHRTPRSPDESRTWLALGGQYRVSSQSVVDFGYAHLFVAGASIHQVSASAGTLDGSYNNSVDIVSAQYSHTF